MKRMLSARDARMYSILNVLTIIYYIYDILQKGQSEERRGETKENRASKNPSSVRLL